MKNVNCLSVLDLTLHYYGEIPTTAPELQHLDNCPLCQERFTALRQDLDAMPILSQSADPAAGTRMAARVSEQLARRHKRPWLPMVGGAVAAAVALIVTFAVWPTQPNAPLPTQAVQTAAHTISLEDDMPDIDLLNNIELLKELDLLRQIEGV